MEKKKQSPLAQAVMRNVMFWGKRAEKTFFIFLGFLLFYTIMMEFSISSAGEEYLAELARQFKIYGMVLGIIIPLITETIYVVPGVGIALSLGAKRSETLWGIQFMLGLLSIQMFLFLVVGNWMLGGDFGWAGAYLTILLLSVGIGEQIGCVTLKSGTKGLVLYLITMFALIFGGGILFICKGGLNLIFSGNTAVVLVPVGVAAVVLCGAGIFHWKKVLSTYEVKL